MPITPIECWRCDLRGCTSMAQTDVERRGWIATTGIEVVGVKSFVAPAGRKYVFCTVEHAIEALQAQILTVGAGA